MIYTELTKKAMKLMFEKHRDQVDKSGIPYVFHPWHVAESMDDELSVCTALLHDIAEDTDTTFEDLTEMGFPTEVVNALKCLTHDKNMDYFEYVKNLSKNRIAAKVKLADLEHNSDLSRLDTITERDRERVNKYRNAREYLLSVLN